MRAVDAGMLADMQEELTFLTDCMIITRGDQVVQYFTSLDQDLLVGGHTYKSILMVNNAAIDKKVDMSVDNTEILGFFLNGYITEADVAGRVYENARVKIFKQNWANTSRSGVPLLSGRIGNIRKQSQKFTMEFRSLNQALALEVCSLISKTCRSLFGDTGSGSSGGCRYPIDPPVWTANSYHNATGAALDMVVPSVANGFQYNCIQSGFTGVSAPAFPTSIAATVTDGGVIWKAVPAIIRLGSISVVVDRKNFTVTGVPGVFPVLTGSGLVASANPNGHGLWDGGGTINGTITITNGGHGYSAETIVLATYIFAGVQVTLAANSVTVSGDVITDIEFPLTVEGQKPVASQVTISAQVNSSQPRAFFLPGYVRWLTGNNQFIKREIFGLTASGSDWVVKMVEALPFDITVGDSVQMIASCDQTLTMCKAYGNVNNMRAEVFVPGTDALTAVQNIGGGKKA